MPSTQTSPALFTRFQELPTELRIKIWGYARQDAVQKNGRYRSHGVLVSLTNPQGNPIQIFTPSSRGGYHPALNANRESRKVNPAIIELEFVETGKIFFRLLGLSGFQNGLLSEDGRYRLEPHCGQFLSFRYFLVSNVN